jgi:sulfur carrier protein ThiS
VDERRKKVMKKLKKLLAVIMVIAMMIPCTAFAATASPAKTLKSVSAKVTVTGTYTYTGSKQTPKYKVTAKVNGKTVTLKSGTDYTATVTKGTDVGSYAIKITGKGKYTGSIKTTYDIDAVKISAASIKASDITYTGTETAPNVVVKYNGKVLKRHVDYKITELDKSVGSHTVVIKGIGNYKGTKEIKYNIVKATQSVKVTTSYKTVAAKTFKKKAASYTIKTTGVKDKAKVTYSSNSKSVTVKNGKITLAKGIKKGTYKVTVTVAATTNYKKATKTLTIKVK